MLLLSEALKRRGSLESAFLVKGQASTDQKSKNLSYLYPSDRENWFLGLVLTEATSKLK